MKQLSSCWPVVVLALLGASLSPGTALASAGPGKACNVQTSTCYASIQSAINAAGSGNTIDIGVGTYAEHLSISTNLTLQGATAGSSIVDGSASGSVLTVGTGATVTIVDVTLRNGSNSFGGGIDNNGTLTLNNDTISGNQASDGGGGIYNAGGSITLNNDTLSGNSASTGGGLENDSSGVLKLTNVTISKNTAANGSGVYLNSGKSTIVNTILAGNTTGSSAGCGSGFFIDFGHNVLDTNPNAGSCSSSSLGNGSNDQEVANPLVNALASNGGPTQTMSLQSGSAAISNGLASTCENLPGGDRDQRGDPRASRSRNACDIGAFDNGGSPTAGRLVAFTVTRSGHTILFHWRMAATRGIAGFNLLSGAQRLNRQLIRAHAGRSYRYHTQFAGHGAFRLELVLTGGTIVVMRPH